MTAVMEPMATLEASLPVDMGSRPALREEAIFAVALECRSNFKTAEEFVDWLAVMVEEMHDIGPKPGDGLYRYGREIEEQTGSVV